MELQCSYYITEAESHEPSQCNRSIGTSSLHPEAPAITRLSFLVNEYWANTIDRSSLVFPGFLKVFEPT